MLFNSRALGSVLLFSATLFGVVVVAAENLQKRAQATGIDISYEDVNWQTAHDNGNSFVYIQATAGKGKHAATLITQRADTFWFRVS